MPTVDELDLPVFVSDEQGIVGDLFHAEMERLLDQRWLARVEPVYDTPPGVFGLLELPIRLT